MRSRVGIAVQGGPALALSSGWPAFAQTLGQGQASDISFVRIALSLLALLLLAAIVLFLFRSRLAPVRLWTPGGARRLHVLESVRLTPQASLCLVSADHVEYLVVVSASGATVLRQHEMKGTETAEGTASCDGR